MKRPFPRLMLAALVLSACAIPAMSKFGIVKTRARFLVPHPPAFYASGHQLRVNVDSVDLRTSSMLVPRVQHFLEEALARESFRVGPEARTELRCTINDAQAFLEPQVRKESVNVHVGEHTETDKNGKSKQVEDCKTQDALVTYLVSRGHLAMEVKARDTRTQDLLMTQTIERAYLQESAIAGPKKCGSGEYGIARGQLQDPFAILGMLGDQAVAETVRLATGFDEPREVLLAVDDELKPGNAQAVAGAWSEALSTWSGVTPHARSTEAARQYNLGVAHEVLASTALREGSLDEAGGHLDQAEACYTQALKLDPEEKYFRDTMARLSSDRQILAQELSQQSQAQAEAGGQPAAPRRAVASSVVSSIPLNGWPAGESDAAHDFRVYVRTRVGAQKQDIGESLRQELLESAADYRVPPAQGRQIVDSEVQRLGVLRQRMDQYREDFQDAATDGVITAEERHMLQKRRDILQLTDAQVKEIEGQTPFREER